MLGARATATPSKQRNGTLQLASALQPAGPLWHRHLMRGVAEVRARAVEILAGMLTRPDMYATGRALEATVARCSGDARCPTGRGLPTPSDAVKPAAEQVAAAAAHDEALLN
jgi:hypothetical protein